MDCKIDRTDTYKHTDSKIPLCKNLIVIVEDWFKVVLRTGIALGFIFVTDFLRLDVIYKFFASLRKCCKKYVENGEVGDRNKNL